MLKRNVGYVGEYRKYKVNNKLGISTQPLPHMWWKYEHFDPDDFLKENYKPSRNQKQKMKM